MGEKPFLPFHCYFVKNLPNTPLFFSQISSLDCVRYKRSFGKWFRPMRLSPDSSTFSWIKIDFYWQILVF